MGIFFNLGSIFLTITIFIFVIIAKSMYYICLIIFLIFVSILKLIIRNSGKPNIKYVIDPSNNKTKFKKGIRWTQEQFEKEADLWGLQKDEVIIEHEESIIPFGNTGIEEINKLNEKYFFYKIDNININITVDSIKKLRDYNINKKMNEIIDNNDYYIKYQIQNLLINRKKYSMYIQELNKIINYKKQETSNDIFSKIKLYFNLIVIKFKKKKIKLNFNVNVLISYTSPAGRNYYERRFYYNYEDLVILKLNMNNQLK